MSYNPSSLFHPLFARRAGTVATNVSTISRENSLLDDDGVQQQVAAQAAAATSLTVISETLEDSSDVIKREPEDNNII